LSATYDKDNLPCPLEEMPLHRKTWLTPMVPVLGPFTVVTQEGPVELPDGWEGFVAVDRAGYPYPVALDEDRETYEPA
jgi:hypothetical protein